MSTVEATVHVVYEGHAPEVEGAGFTFPRGKAVEVPAKLAETLGGAFKIVKKGKGA